MRGLEEHLEAAQDDGESEIASEEERDNMDRDSDDCSTDDLEPDPELRAQQLEDHDREVTDDEAGEVAEGEETEIGDETEIGETVTKGGDDDPKKKPGQEFKPCPQTPEQKHTKTQDLEICESEMTRKSSIFFGFITLVARMYATNCERWYEGCEPA
jgi:hypothetical protein